MKEKFKLAGLRDEVPEVEDLSNTERAMLRVMAEPGNPLWKIMRKMIDYREGLTQALLDVDFGDPLSLAAGAKVRSNALSIIWLEEFLAAALTDVEEHNTEEKS